MANQTSRLKEDRHVGPIQAVTRSASSVLGDALDLIELQSRLLKVDASQCVGRIKVPLVATIVALGILISSLPVVALGLASLLAWLTEWPGWICQLIVGIGFVVLGLGLAFWSMQRMRRALAVFATSSREASANIRWLRQTLDQTFSGKT